jgi:oligoendopeptidase F
LRSGPTASFRFDEALAAMQSDDRDSRLATAAAISEGLDPGLRTRAYIYNTLLADKAADDRLRGHHSWASSRNLGNQTSDEAVEALVHAVVSRYDLVQRWYRLKAKLFGLDRLHFSDRNAPLPTGEAEVRVPWNEAKATVLESFHSFSPRISNLARDFFDEQRIDAPSHPGKNGGAFCMPTVPGATPYVMVNYNGTQKDVLMLAHELGHGVHFALAQQNQSVFQVQMPLTVAETASVFGETVTFSRMLDAETDPLRRLSLLGASLDSDIATVFRQVSMFRFEDLCHRARRSDGELSIDAINAYWISSQQELFGDTVDTDGYESWWSYIHHFVHVPGYVYAYAFGQLLATSVYERFLATGPSFVAQYEAMLAGGGSKSPEALAAMVDCDLLDPNFWSEGLGLIERTLTDAEQTAQLLAT